MADKRKGKKRREELTQEEPEKPSKEEYAIAKWLRKNVTTKKTKFLNHNVEYFTAVKAVDALMISHWVQVKEGEEPFFSSRLDVVEFLDKMLRHKFFHRAKKVPVSEQELKAKLKKKDKDRKKDGEEKYKKEEEKGEDAESSHAEGEKKDDKSGLQSEDKEKKKRKIRLEMHLDQIFVDGLDAYVWIYDPIPVHYWFFGTMVVLGTIAICLFPLWPPSVRKGVYYLSIAAAGFLVFIIALAALRVLVFCLVWTLTLGKHHLWLLPNLMEDVGFLASFWPLYKYEYKGGETKGKKKSKKKKEKDSDNEDEKQDDDTLVKDEDVKTEDEERCVEQVEEVIKEAENSESESESSQKSQTGKDFEMVEREEVES